MEEVKKIIISICLCIISFSHIIAKKPYLIPQDITKDGVSTLINLNFEDLDRRTRLNNLIQELDGEFTTIEEVEEEVEQYSRTLYARDILTEQRYDLIDDDVQGQLFELGREKLQRTSSIDKLYNTMEVDLLIGGTASDANDPNIGVGSTTTPSYPVTIQRDSPQIFIQPSSQEGGYTISSDTEDYTVYLSSVSLYDTWISSRYYAGHVEYKGDYYIISGQDNNDNPLYDIYKSTTNGVDDFVQISTSADLSTYAFGRRYCANDEYIFAIGGRNTGTGSNISLVERSTDGINWPNVGHAPWSDRYGMAVFCDEDNRIFVIGGRESGTDTVGDIWVSTDNANSWNQMSPDNFPKQGDIRAYYDQSTGKVIIPGGYVQGGNRPNDLYEADISSMTVWTNKTSGSSNQPNFDPGYMISKIKDKYFVIGGINNDEIWSSQDLVNWTQEVSDMALGGDIEHADSFTYNNDIYMFFGRYNTYHEIWKTNIDSSLSFYYGSYYIKDSQNKTHFYISQKDTITYINDKLSLKLNETGRYIQDDDTNKEIDISTYTHVPELEVDGDIHNIYNAITDGTITGKDIHNSTITTVDIATDGVTTTDIKDRNVTEPKLSEDSVGTYQIINSTIQSVDIDTDAVTTEKLADLNYINFTSTTSLPYKEGKIFYDSEKDSFVYYNSSEDFEIELDGGVRKVRNLQGTTINRGDVVYITGSSGDNTRVKLADANDIDTSRVIGMVISNSINNNGTGFIRIFNRVRQLDTSSYVAGDTVYLSTSTLGGLSTTKPRNPDVAIRIGTVIRSHATEGIITLDIDREIDNFNPNRLILSDNAGELIDSPYAKWDSTNNIINSTITYSQNSDKLNNEPYEHFVTTEGNHPVNYIDFDEQLEELLPGVDVERVYAFDQSGKSILKSANSDGITKTYAHDDLSIIRNNSTFTITTGKLVYSAGSTGNIHDVELALATTTAKVPAIGVAIEPISSGGYGYIAKRYELDGLDTSMLAEGDEVYLSTSSKGNIQNTKPTHPYLIQHVGTVLKSNAGSGIIDFTIDTYVGHLESGTIESTFSIGKPDSQDVTVEFYSNKGTHEDITYNGDRFVISTHTYITGYSSATTYYGDGSNLTGISSSGGDNLGNHIATTTLNMSGNEIINTPSFDAFVSTAGDTMSGDLDMDGNHLISVSSITLQENNIISPKYTNSSNGYSLLIRGGEAVADSGNYSGGDVNIIGGNAVSVDSSGGAGGDVKLEAGINAGTNQSGSILIYAGDSNYKGGDIILDSGNDTGGALSEGEISLRIGESEYFNLSNLGLTISTTTNMSNSKIINIDWANSDDGTGSELDADFLDGLDSTDFQLDLSTPTWTAYNSDLLDGLDSTDFLQTGDKVEQQEWETVIYQGSVVGFNGTTLNDIVCYKED